MRSRWWSKVRRVLRIEPLEDRRQLNGQPLVVVATDGNDLVSLSIQGDIRTLTINGAAQQLAPEVEAITVTGSCRATAATTAAYSASASASRPPQRSSRHGHETKVRACSVVLLGTNSESSRGLGTMASWHPYGVVEDRSSGDVDTPAS